jgi:hypothetical protein
MAAAGGGKDRKTGQIVFPDWRYRRRQDPGRESALWRHQLVEFPQKVLPYRNADTFQVRI